MRNGGHVTFVFDDVPSRKLRVAVQMAKPDGIEPPTLCLLGVFSQGHARTTHGLLVAPARVRRGFHQYDDLFGSAHAISLQLLKL
jgi:hypothetical protein